MIRQESDLMDMAGVVNSLRPCVESPGVGETRLAKIDEAWAVARRRLEAALEAYIKAWEPQ